MTRRQEVTVACCSLLGALAASESATRADPTWQVFQLTSGPNQDFAPDVSGTTYVWHRNDNIYAWTEGGGAPTVISSDSGNSGARISGQRVVWSRSFSGDSEIIQWLNGTLSTLTNNSYDDRQPDAGGYAIAWFAQGLDTLIYDDGVQQTLVSANVVSFDEYPNVMDDWLVWEASINGSSDMREIWFWSGGAPVRLTNNGFQDVRPETDGTTIVWYAFNGPSGSGEIYRWTASDGVVRLTNNAVYDVQPDVSGDAIVYARQVGPDFEIFLRFAGIDYQITDNSYDDFEPQIDGNRVVWEGKDNGGSHIFYAVVDGLVPTELPGACCLDLDCLLLTQTDCTVADGTFNGTETFCDVDSCGVAPAGGWSTFQHDARRSGQGEGIVSDQPNRVWSVLTGDEPLNLNRFAPMIGPDGTIYVAADELVAIAPDGSLRWTAVAPTHASGAVREDGVLFTGGSTISKRDPATGAGLCGMPGDVTYPAALDSDGDIYFRASTFSIRKMGPGCNTIWTYTTADSPNSHIAIGTDGGIHATSDARFFKLDPEVGEEIWSVSTGENFVGQPAIRTDGVIYHTIVPDQLLATNPDGSEHWLHTFDHPGFSVNTASPAVATDGTAYVVSRSVSTSEWRLSAVDSSEDELWSFLIGDTFGYEPFSPVIDGAGKILFAVLGDIIAISPIDGTELWRVNVGEGDVANSSPAIAQDGTLYVTTDNGYLIAFAEGCAEPPPQSPPFIFRRVLTEGDFVDGSVIDQIKNFDLGSDGRVTIIARIGQHDASFQELTDGSFDVIRHGDLVDGYEIDTLSLMRLDANGNTYLPAFVAGEGYAIFVNGELYVSEGPFSPPAPVVINSFQPGTYVDPNNAGQFLVYGKRTAAESAGLLSIDTATSTVTPILLEDQSIDGFFVDSLNPAVVQGYGDDGVPFTRAQMNPAQYAVMTPTEVIARTGDVIDGVPIGEFLDPRRTQAGGYFFNAVAAIYGRSPGGSLTRRRGTGETVAGQPLLGIDDYVVSEDEELAYSATLLGGRLGVFFEDDPVAVEQVTSIDGTPVAEVGSSVANLGVQARRNADGQIAFIARLGNEPYALFVATPLMTLDLNQDGQVSLPDVPPFVDCLAGPGELVPSTCVPADATGDCSCSLDDFAALQTGFGGGAP